MARHALLIGVSKFDDQRLASLNAPSSDVEVFAGLLRDPACGGFDSAEVSLDEDYLTVRDRLGALFGKREPDDLLLLYYSGHGILDLENTLYFATPASDLDNPDARSLSAGDLNQQMRRSRAEQQIIVLDCCHSGAFAEGAKGATPNAVTQDTFDAAAGGRYVLTAATAQQFAWDGGTLREGNPVDRHLSRFTSWLVDGLRGGQAAPDDDQITMDDLYRYVCRRAKAEGSPATPQRYVDRGTGEMVIGRNPAAIAPALAALSARLADADWSTRGTAVEELARLSRKSGPAAKQARDALLDRLAEERDFKVRSVLLKALGLEEEREEAAPPPPPPPPAAPPQPQERPAAPFVPPYDLDAREQKALAAAGVPRESWWTLPMPVLERVRLLGKAGRNGMWMDVCMYIALVFDLGALGNVNDPSAATGVWALLIGQVIGGGAGLLGLNVKAIPAGPAVASFSGPLAGIEVVKSGWWNYDRRRFRRFCQVMLAAGVVTTVVAFILANR